MMPAISVRIDRDLYTRLKEQKPHFLSDAAFLNLVISQAISDKVDKNEIIPPNNPYTLSEFQKNSSTAVEAVKAVSSKAVTSNARALSIDETDQKISPRQNGTNPRLNGLINALPEELKPLSDLIRDFWRVKRGSKGERAFALLETGLKAIHDADGHDAVKHQLELAINGKWQSVTFANYEKFKPQPKAWEKEPEVKHPAYRDFTAERLERERQSQAIGF